MRFLFDFKPVRAANHGISAGLLLVFMLGTGCAGGSRATDGRARLSTSPSARSGLWMDCCADADCPAGQDLRCHVAVAGGTCAPACLDAAYCQGMDAALTCTAGLCTPPSAAP